MEEFLKDINAVVGVTGCFVCDEEGQVLASALPGVFDEAMLSVAGRTTAQTIEGLKIATQRLISDLDLLYREGRFIVKNLQGGYLCILCVRNINLPLLNLMANMAARKLAGKIKERVKEAEVKPLEWLKVMSSFLELLVEELGAKGFGRDHLLRVVEHRLRRLRVKYPFFAPINVIEGKIDLSPLETASVSPAEIAQAWGELIKEMYQSAVANLGPGVTSTKYRQVYETLYRQHKRVFESLGLKKVLPE